MDSQKSKKQNWIVKIKKDAINTLNNVEEIHKNISISKIYKDAYHGFLCQASEEDIVNLANSNDIIEEYYPDVTYHIKETGDRNLFTKKDVEILSQSVQPFIQRIGADHSSQMSGNGSGSLANRTDINVFIVDTGIYPHADLNIIAGMNFTSSNGNAWVDDNGHGTHVAGIAGAYDNTIGVVGVAPGVNLWAIKVLDASGSGLSSTIITALNWILSHRGIGWSGYGIVNMSLGGPAFQPLDDAVANLTNNGIIVCVAAGNDSQNAINESPARSPSALTVGATMPNPSYNTLASYSNYGSILDILAPGSNILSTYLNNGYATLSGTSMATPIISGTVALMLSTVYQGSPTNAGFVGNVRNTLRYVSTPLSYPNYDGTVTPNPKITLSTAAINANTTDISVRSGSF